MYFDKKYFTIASQEIRKPTSSSVRPCCSIFISKTFHLQRKYHITILLLHVRHIIFMTPALVKKKTFTSASSSQGEFPERNEIRTYTYKLIKFYFSIKPVLPFLVLSDQIGVETFKRCLGFSHFFQSVVGV